MAVYTHVDAAELAGFLLRYDLGEAVSFKGIAEGVENSNYILDTTTGRFILTLYEKRVDADDLPWFLGLMAYLAAAGLPVPGPVADRHGQALQTLAGRPACLIQFLAGVSVVETGAAAAREVGRALGALHRAGAGYGPPRANPLGPTGWPPLAARTEGRLFEIDPALPAIVGAGLQAAAEWPRGLRQGVIHADLFPDNVLMLDGRVTGLIDFYFACTDYLAYDYAVTHAAWCFSADGRQYHPDRARALAEGYAETHGLETCEMQALPRLGMGAALRFTLTRAFDWLNTPAGALVTRKDPMAFARRLAWYGAARPEAVLGHG